MQKTIYSIKNQTFKDYEVWIVDGGSAKDVLNFLEKLEAPFYYKSEKDVGIYDAMNKGTDLATGDWLYFLGAEDIFFNKNVLQDVFKNKEIDKSNLFSGKITYRGVLNPFVYSKNKLIKSPSWSFFMWFRNGLHHQGTFYRNTLFIDVKYPLVYNILSDYWFNLFLYKRKENCVIVDETIAICTSDGVSKSGKWGLYQEEIKLKTNLSSKFFSLFFYIIAAMKFLSRKIVND